MFYYTSVITFVAKCILSVALGDKYCTIVVSIGTPWLCVVNASLLSGWSCISMWSCSSHSLVPYLTSLIPHLVIFYKLSFSGQAPPKISPWTAHCVVSSLIQSILPIGNTQYMVTASKYCALSSHSSQLLPSTPHKCINFSPSQSLSMHYIILICSLPS